MFEPERERERERRERERERERERYDRRKLVELPDCCHFQTQVLHKEVVLLKSVVFG